MTYCVAIRNEAGLVFLSDLRCERDALKVSRHKLIGANDEYFASIRGRWAGQLKKVFNELPAPGYWP